MPMSTQRTHERSQREQTFWNHVRNGSSWTAACEAVGVHPRQGYRWRKANGGRIPTSPRAISGRYLSLDERLRIADAHLAGDGVRAIATTLGRAPSTISRELRRNATTPPTRALRPRRPPGRVTYEPYAAPRRAAQRGLRPKVAKLDDPVIGPVLSAYVEAKMDLRWSPQQIAHELAVDFPDRQELRVSP